MRVDRHHDPTMELESRLLSELDFIAQQLRGKITQSMYANSEGKQSKVITIEYDLRAVSYTHLTLPTNREV